MPMGPPTSSASTFEERLDQALLADSVSLQPCPESVRTLLEVLQQQPFLPAYAANASPAASEVREELLELSSAQQTQVLVKILRVLKVSFREPSNRQVLRKADMATLMEHLRLQRAPSVVSECAMVLLNTCFEPLSAMHLAELDSLSIFCGILDGKHDAGQQAAVTGIIQSICLQAKGRVAVRSSSIVPALLCLLRAGSQSAQAGAAAALANLSCEPQSVRLIRRSNGILPLVHFLGSTERDGATSAAAAVRNLSCEAASRELVREAGAVKSLVCLLGSGHVHACICASRALLNILLPVVRSKGGEAKQFWDPLQSLLTSAMVLSMVQHSLHVLDTANAETLNTR